MIKRQSFLKGIVLLAGAGIIVKLIGFFYRVILTNMPGYGDEGNGIYGSGYQVYLVLYALSTTGFPAAISKLVAEKMALGEAGAAHRIFRVSARLLAVMGLILSFLLFIGSDFIASMISNSRTFYTMIAISPTIFFVCIMAAFRGYFQGMQDMSPQANSQVVEQLAKTIATIALAYLLMPYGVELSAAGATLGTTIGAAAGALYLWALYNRRKKELWARVRSHKSKKRPQPAIRIIFDLIKISVPVSFGAVILTAANIIDLTSVMSQLEKAGFDSITANKLYGILTGKCYVLTHFPVAITAALATSLVPAIAGSVAVKNLKSAAAKISESLRLTILICLPASAGMAVLAEPVLKLLFSGSSEGADLLAVSAFTIIFTGLTQTLSGILQGLGKPLIPALGLLAGAAAKVAINFTLISNPEINIKGAVYGTLACYIISTVINIIALKVNFTLKLDILDFIIKPAVSTFAMAVCVHYAYNILAHAGLSNFFAAIFSVLTGIIIYGLLIILSGAVAKEDLSYLVSRRKVGRIKN